MTTALMKRMEDKTTFDQMLSQADLFVKSRFFPSHVDTKEKAVVIMMKGRELGLPFTEALSKICVIHGQPCTKVETLLGLARSTKEMESFKIEFSPSEANPQRCMVTIKRKGFDPHSSSFGDAEAAAQGLSSKDNYKKQKGVMYQWRAIAKNLRVTFPDAIGGMYLAEEIASEVTLSPTGEVTEIQTAPPKAIEAPADAKSEASELSGEDIPDDQLGNFELPQGRHKFAGMRLSAVIGEVNDTGKATGFEFLEKMADSARDPKVKCVVSRFLKIITEQ